MMLLHQDPPSDPTLNQSVVVLQSEKDKYSLNESLSIVDIDNKILEGEVKQEFLDAYHQLSSGKSGKEHHLRLWKK